MSILEFDVKMEQTLDKLQAELKLESRAEVIRRSVALMTVAIKESVDKKVISVGTQLVVF